MLALKAFTVVLAFLSLTFVNGTPIINTHVDDHTHQQSKEAVQPHIRQPRCISLQNYPEPQALRIEYKPNYKNDDTQVFQLYPSQQGPQLAARSRRLQYPNFRSRNSKPTLTNTLNAERGTPRKQNYQRNFNSPQWRNQKPTEVNRSHWRNQNPPTVNKSQWRNQNPPVVNKAQWRTRNPPAVNKPLTGGYQRGPQSGRGFYGYNKSDLSPQPLLSIPRNTEPRNKTLRKPILVGNHFQNSAYRYNQSPRQSDSGVLNNAYQHLNRGTP